jgi:hypothetical protein
MSHTHSKYSIWFFTGVLLTIYGVLILGAGLMGLSAPSDHKVVLSELHADIWGGAILLLLGLVYLYHYAPRGNTK